jgi:hypothetical protein
MMKAIVLGKKLKTEIKRGTIFMDWENQYYKNGSFNQAPVAHACNPSYSRSRDQEDRCSKPAQANSSRDSILKNMKKGW